MTSRVVVLAPLQLVITYTELRTRNTAVDAVHLEDRG